MRIPFADGGRDHQACDCWGLARLVMHEQCGVLLPTYGEISASDLAGIAGKMTVDCDGEDWLEVKMPQAFDFAVMRWFGKREIGHVGIMVDSRNVLHTEDRTGSPVIAPVKHPHIARRIVGYRRHRSLVK